MVPHNISNVGTVTDSDAGLRVWILIIYLM